MSTESNSEIFNNKFRSVFWPIHNHELGKFIPMSILMFCILFNQNILRILKDSVLISEMSSEIASFTKVYCVMPTATIFVIIYAKMVNIYSFEKIFLYLNLVFLTIFLIFAFIIYPNVDAYHINSDSVHVLMLEYPHLKWYIALFSNWSYVVFYSFAELWPNIFYVLLFWQFANELTTTSEAKRFYSLLSLFGNSSLIFVGFIMMNLASERTIARYFFDISSNKVFLVQISMILVLIFSFASCFMVNFITRNIFTNKIYYTKIPTLKTSSMGIIQSFRYIAASKYLWLLLICSAAFGLTMNLVEAVWKAKIKELYPSVNSYAEFNSLYVLWTGVAIMIMTVIGNNVMRIYNWFAAAIICPVIILITGTMFFILVVFDKEIISISDGAILMSPLALAVLVGSIQNILAKGTKYSIWDASREMLYIPLDNELKTKGKAAVDVISAKVGKSSSGLIQSIIFTIFPSATFSSISSFLMCIFIIVCLLWIYSVKAIYHEYMKLIGHAS